MPELEKMKTRTPLEEKKVGDDYLKGLASRPPSPLQPKGCAGSKALIPLKGWIVRLKPSRSRVLWTGMPAGSSVIPKTFPTSGSATLCRFPTRKRWPPLRKNS